MLWWYQNAVWCFKDCWIFLGGCSKCQRFCNILLIYTILWGEIWINLSNAIMIFVKIFNLLFEFTGQVNAIVIILENNRGLFANCVFCNSMTKLSKLLASMISWKLALYCLQLCCLTIPLWGFINLHFHSHTLTADIKLRFKLSSNF